MLTVREIVDRLGGVAKVRRKLGGPSGPLSHQSIYRWINDNEIPAGRAFQIVREYGGLIDINDIPTRDV